jgi:steroid delta-isomerase-like uncharacterized protein
MKPQQMKELTDRHIAAEIAGDTADAVSVYTDDVEHDVVGSPTGPIHGRTAAQGFYDQLVADLDTERMALTREQYGEDFCVVEHECTGVAKGEFMGIPGNGRRVTFRILHVWDFKDGAISREQVWVDGGSIAAQLAAPE